GSSRHTAVKLRPHGEFSDKPRNRSARSISERGTNSTRAKVFTGNGKSNPVYVQLRKMSKTKIAVK
ncbi:MAG TPA: hypothetical protein VKB29_09045, partial [Candidatus Binataceae bacterium]|nr:hypothetical protein [Candidatus Binataceae bacterium]